MVENLEFESFLSGFTIEELENIRYDSSQIYCGNKINYIVDTYDIINYTLPFTDSKFSKNENRNLLSQFTIAYEVVFSNSERFNFALANEYNEELSNIIDNLNGKIKNFPKIKDRLLKNILDNPLINESEKSDFLQKNIELFTVVYIFLKHGNNIYDRFNFFLENDLSISVFDSGDKVTDNIVTEVFKNIQTSNLTSELFDSFVEQSKMKLISFDQDIERYCYLDNTYRDISVVDRVFKANEKLEKDNVSFRYLSSAPYKTSKIFNILSKKIDVKGYKKFNRNIMQLFLLNYILDNTVDVEESNDLVDNLIQFKLMQKEINTPNFDKENYYNTKVITSLNDTFSNYRDNLEKSFFYKTFFNYKSKFDTAIDKYEANDSIELINYFKQFDGVNEGLYTDIGIQNNLSPMLKMNQTFYLSQKFKPSSIAENLVRIKYGKDIIRNTFHHLPNLLFLDFKEKSDLMVNFHQLLDTLSSNSKLVGFKSPSFRDEFKKIINQLSNNHSSLEIQSVDFLILSYLNIITEKEESTNLKDAYDQLTPQDEVGLIEILLQHKSILEKSFGAAKIVAENGETKLIYTSRRSKMIAEIDYLLIWLYRRNLSFDKAIEIGNVYIGNNVQDPRFFHGMGLVYHSRAYFYLEQNREFSIIENEFSQAKEMMFLGIDFYYEKIENSEVLPVERNLIYKQIVGLLNTAIDSNLRRMAIKDSADKKFALIDESRRLLIFLKDVITKVKYNDYTSLETINHTECELEYFEALRMFKRGELRESLSKLNHSTTRSRNYMDSKYLVMDRFKALSSKINGLRDDCIKTLYF